MDHRYQLLQIPHFTQKLRPTELKLLAQSQTTNLWQSQNEKPSSQPPVLYSRLGFPVSGFLLKTLHYTHQSLFKQCRRIQMSQNNQDFEHPKQTSKQGHQNELVFFKLVFYILLFLLQSFSESYNRQLKSHLRMQKSQQPFRQFWNVYIKLKTTKQYPG